MEQDHFFNYTWDAGKMKQQGQMTWHFLKFDKTNGTTNLEKRQSPRQPLLARQCASPAKDYSWILSDYASLFSQGLRHKEIENSCTCSFILLIISVYQLIIISVYWNSNAVFDLVYPKTDSQHSVHIILPNIPKPF